MGGIAFFSAPCMSTCFLHLLVFLPFYNSEPNAQKKRVLYSCSPAFSCFNPGPPVFFYYFYIFSRVEQKCLVLLAFSAFC
jgi:hypothetical protein